LRSTSRRLCDWAVLAGLALAFLCLDQISKVLVRQNLAIGEAWAPVPALAKVFTVTHVQNTGVAFGQMPGLGWLFMLVNLAVLVAIVVYYPRIPAGQWPLRLAAALILAGDLGNIIDRLRTAILLAQETGSFWRALPRASVTDFFDFKIWPVWNVADMCVVSGVAILAVMLWRAERAERAAQIRTQDAGRGTAARDE
jgi:signal peptidase II